MFKTSAIWLLGLFLLASLLGLGTWQLQRLAWKEALIQRVDERVHAAPVAPPSSQPGHEVNAAADEYRHVQLDGVWQPEHTSLVQANTILGPGFWVMTPLRNSQHELTWINRGFVTERNTPIKTPTGTVHVEGLLRLNEPQGSWLRPNQPGHAQWYSRDVKALSLAHGLGAAAPYFIDADAAPGQARSAEPQPGQPLGGLTVISFNNHHLSYALTWYGLALLVVVAGFQFKRLSSRPLALDDNDPDSSRRAR
jgi:surfeit locus 1 family protein